MTLISPGWAPEKFLAVTALASSAQGVVVLRVVGEVDLATLGQLREHLHQYVSSDDRGLVLDCTEVSFLAACGIGLLVEIAERARAQGMALRLVTHTPLVLRAVRLALADQLIPRAPTVAEAVTQCVA